MTIIVGDKIPEGTFKYVPYTPELENGVSFMTLNKSLAHSPNPSSSVVSVSDIEMMYHKTLQPNVFFSHGVVHKRLEREESCPLLRPRGLHCECCIPGLRENIMISCHEIFSQPAM